MSVKKQCVARYDELYDKAIARYLDKTDWDISEWMNDKEWLEFKELSCKLFGELCEGD